MKIHYLGPPATFTHQAALELFDDKMLKPSTNIEEVLDNVKKKQNDSFYLVLQDRIYRRHSW